MDTTKTDEVMQRLSSDNPKARWHHEETHTGRSSWGCVPIRDAVEVREEALRLLRIETAAKHLLEAWPNLVHHPSMNPSEVIALREALARQEADGG